MKKIKPIKAKHNNKIQPFRFKELQTCTHVFYRRLAVKTGLDRPYTGPHKIIERLPNNTNMVIEINGRPKTVNIELIKPAHYIPEEGEQTQENERDQTHEVDESEQNRIEQEQTQTHRQTPNFPIEQNKQSTPNTGTQTIIREKSVTHDKSNRKVTFSDEVLLKEFDATENQRPVINRDIFNPSGKIIKANSGRKWEIGKEVSLQNHRGIWETASQTGIANENRTLVVKIKGEWDKSTVNELQFLSKNARYDQINYWKEKEAVPYIGIPQLYDNGYFQIRNKRYRFIILEKLGISLEDVLKRDNFVLSINAACHIAWQLTIILEYMHKKGFVHANMQPRKILINEKDKSQIYLVGYGAVSEICRKVKPVLAEAEHIKYASREAHIHAIAPRGEFESLVYNLITWLGGTLPWERISGNKLSVTMLKINGINKHEQFLKDCFKEREVPNIIRELLTTVRLMGHDDTPDYKKIKEIFLGEMARN